LIILFMLGCFLSKSLKHVGVVDRKENKICEVILFNEDIIFVESKLCDSLKEGDVIKIQRKR